MKKYLHTTIEFYLDGNQVPHTGFVIDEKPGFVVVKVEHGIHHGEEWEIPTENVIDDSYDQYEASDERIYAWFDGE